MSSRATHSQKLERRIEFDPAFDKRHTDPDKDYGIHGVNMRWLLIGPEGAIQFLVFTNWMLPHVAAETRPKLVFHPSLLEPLPADIGYHSPKPMYEGQTAMGDKCDVLKGTCYYDGSSLRAQDVFNILVEKGGEAVWEYMEGEYEARFGGAK